MNERRIQVPNDEENVDVAFEHTRNANRMITMGESKDMDTIQHKAMFKNHKN